MRPIDFFFWLLAARDVFQAVRPSVSYNNAKRTIPVREKQQKHLQPLVKTMKRINETNSKTNWSSRKSASETREPFRSQVINGAQKKGESLLFFVVWRCFTTSRWRTFEWTLRSVSCMFFSFRLYVSRGFTKTWVGLVACALLPSGICALWPVFHRTLRPVLFDGMWYFMSSVLSSSWSNALLVTGISNPKGCQWQVSAGDTSWLWRRQKGDAN